MVEVFHYIASILPLIGAVSVVVFVVSLLSLPWLVARIPEDYFLHRKPKQFHWSLQFHFLIHILFKLGKNLLSLILLAGGLLMLFIPGQGILTIVMGIILLDYPNKFQIEQKIVSNRVILNGLNWLRKKGNKTPLRVK